MPLFNVKITIAANNTPQAVTDTELAAASPVIESRKSKANQIIIYSETGNSAVTIARVGGQQVHRSNAIGGPLEPGGQARFEAGGGIAIHPFDVKTTYVSGTVGDVFNYTWLTE